MGRSLTEISKKNFVTTYFKYPGKLSAHEDTMLKANRTTC